MKGAGQNKRQLPFDRPPWALGGGDSPCPYKNIQEREDACSARERDENIILREARKYLKSENFHESESFARPNKFEIGKEQCTRK